MPVEGALIYHKAPDNVILAFQISCAMPEGDSAICATTIADWIGRVATAYAIPTS